MAQVSFTYNATPAPACYPPDVNGLASLLTSTMLAGTVPDTAGGGILVGTAPPSSALVNKVWFKTDTAGRPLGVYLFYNGNWRKMYQGNYGDIKLYIGDFNSVFDGTGLGIIGGNQDGWAVCNGNNGTPNYWNTGYFPASGAWDGSKWVSFVDGLGGKPSGGIQQIQIGVNNLPPMKVNVPYLLPSLAGPGGGCTNIQPDGATNTSTSHDYRVRDMSNNAFGNNTPMNTVPPFIAMAYLMFVGYA